MIEYIVNEEKKTVVAKFKRYDGNNDRETWQHYIENHVLNLIEKSDIYYNLSRYNGRYNDNDIIGEELDKLDCRFYGIAHCSDKDTFDVNFGKELAKKRLLKKYYKVQMNYEKRINSIVDNIAARIAAAINTDRLKLVKFTDEIGNMSL